MSETGKLFFEGSGFIGIGNYEERVADGQEDWTHVRIGPNRYPRSWIQELSGSQLQVSIPRSLWVEEPLALELRMLLSRWRALGRDDLADRVEVAYADGQIWDLLGKSVPDTPEIRVLDRADCQFVRRMIAAAPTTRLHISATPESLGIVAPTVSAAVGIQQHGDNPVSRAIITPPFSETPRFSDGEENRIAS